MSIGEVCLPATLSNEVHAHMLQIVGVLQNKHQFYKHKEYSA